MRKFLLLSVLVLIQFCISSPLYSQSKFTLKDWMKLSDETKLSVIDGFIKLAQRDGVTMKLSPKYYVDEIDNLIKNSIDNKDTSGLDSSLGLQIHTIAAMDGDWNNGENPIEHLKKLMGEETFETFKKTYPDKYNKLLELSK